MVVIDLVRNWNKNVIPSIVAGLVSTDQKNRGSPGIKRV